MNLLSVDYGLTFLKIYLEVLSDRPFAVFDCQTIS